MTTTVAAASLPAIGDGPQTKAAVASGEAVAALYACGASSATFGLLVVGAEASPRLKAFLAFSAAAGPLSGKALVAVVTLVVAWVGLHAGLRRRELNLGWHLRAALVLVGIGLLLTFPPIFSLFGS